MRKLLQILLLLLSITVLYSCDKVIDVELKTIAPQYVIEGRVTDGLLPWTVILSTTQNFEEDDAFKGISGAKVVIKTADRSIVLNEAAKGVYHSVPLKGTPGQSYQLTVNINGKVFTASSKMPQASAFLNLYMNSVSTLPSFIKLGMVYEDLQGENNFYWFESYVNGNKLSGFNVYNDEFNDGMVVNQQIVFTNPTKNKAYDLKKGDELRVDMLCIDPLVYTYLFSLNNGSSLEYNGATPSNPASNIKGGALGYFSAHTLKSKKIIVP